MVRTRNAERSSSTARPSAAATAAALVSEDKQSVHEKTLTLIPITSPYDPRKPGLRGTYRIPTTLHDSLSKFLNPNLKWGFVLCCVGGQDTADLEDRIGSVEKYLDGFVGEDLEDEVDGDDGHLRGREEIKRETTERSVGVTVEIHPRRNQVTEPVGDVEDEVDGHAAIETRVAKNAKRRKTPVREPRATKARGAVSSLDDNDDDSDPGNEIGATRETKRQRFYDSDQAQLQLQLGHSPLTDSSAYSEDESDTDTEIPNSRGSRTTVDKEYRPATTIRQDGRIICFSKRRKRIEDNGKPRQIQPYKRRDHKTTHLPQWPAAMISIGPKDNQRHGISSERAIKMVEQRAKVKGVNMPNSYAAFFARLFSLDTMENLTNGCRRYNTIMNSLSPTERNPVNQLQVTELATMSGAPEEVKELVKIYLNIETDDKVCGVVIGNAINYHQQTLFVRKLTIAHNQIMDIDSEVSTFLKKWVVEAGRRVPSSRLPWVNELNNFIMSQASGGQVRQQEDVKEWRQQRARFGRMCRLGGNLNTLSEMCTGAIWLLVGAMRGGKSHDLNEYMKPDNLRDFVGEVLAMVPEYSACFKELNERLWKPILKRQQIPSIRLFNIDGDPEALRNELKKKSVRYWLEFDDVAKMDID